MISGESKLETARDIILEGLSEKIKEMKFDRLRLQLTIILFSGIKLFIRYNDYGEYGYQIQYSPNKLDRIRYDNYDEKWDVGTKPHHAHLRNQKEAVNSEMQGNPKLDIPKIIELIS